MKDYVRDIIRRVEILARVINGEAISKGDFADEYNNIATVTIGRDLEWLRGHGIQIFSRKNRVFIDSTVPKSQLVKLIAEYLPLKLNSDVFLKQMKIFSKQKDTVYLSYLALLAKAVNEGRYLNITYQRLRDEEILSYKLKPIRLIPSGYNWILYALKEDETIFQSFFVSRMKEVIVSKNKFKSMPAYKEKGKAIKMIFRFPPEVSSEVIDKIWFDDALPVIDDQGYIIFETKQEITNSLASWCISWWDKIEIIEPVELKEHIHAMFESFSKKNKLSQNPELFPKMG